MFKESFEYDLHHSSYGQYVLKNYNISTPVYESSHTKIYRLNHPALKNRMLKVIKRHEGVDLNIEKAISIDHPNISKIYEYGKTDQYLYIIKEYVEGLDLEKYVAKYGPMSEGQATGAVKEICKILKYLHEQDEKGIIYRDLKPANIIFKENSPIKLIDSITLRNVKGKESDTFYVGTRGFSPPEQFGYSESTPASDIYSLGATYYYLLTGKVPKTTWILKKEIGYQPNISFKIRWTINKAMALDPKNRFPSTDDFLGFLKRPFILILFERYFVKGLALLLVIFLGGLLINYPQKEVLPLEVPVPVTYFDSLDGPKDIELESFYSIDRGVDLKVTDQHLRIIFEDIHHGETLEKARYYSLKKTDTAYKDHMLQSDIFFDLESSQNIKKYYGQELNLDIDDDDNIAVYFYTEDKRPLAYYFYNGVKPENARIPIKYQNASGVILEDIYPIDQGIKWTYERVNGRDELMVTIDAIKLPQALSDYKYITVYHSKYKFDEDYIKKIIYNAVVLDQGMTLYQPMGFLSNANNSKYALIVIFSEDKTPIGYKVIDLINQP